MDNEQRAMAAGAGAGCASCGGCFVAVLGCSMAFSYFLWKVQRVRIDIFRGPATMVWGSILGVLIGVAVGIGVGIIVKKKMSQPSR